MTHFFSPLRFAFKGGYALLTIGISLLYLILPTLLINNKLVILIFLGDDPLLFKFSFLVTLFIGALSILPPIEIFFTVLTAILLGINVSLLVQTIRILSTQKKVSLAVGGASLLAVAGTGCASCGLSILSLLGISTTLLPIHGTGFLIISAGLLLLSLVVILRNKKIVCELT